MARRPGRSFRRGVPRETSRWSNRRERKPVPRAIVAVGPRLLSTSIKAPLADDESDANGEGIPPGGREMRTSTKVGLRATAFLSPSGPISQMISREAPVAGGVAVVRGLFSSTFHVKQHLTRRATPDYLSGFRATTSAKDPA